MKHYITDPPCAFVEAVVAGYSPVDKWTCHFARVAAKMRLEPWWFHAPGRYKYPERGQILRSPSAADVWTRGDTLSGEIPRRTLHAEPSGTSASG